MSATRYRTFIGINGPITGFEAQMKYPDPKFFERGTPRMTHDELREMIHRNADEMERVIQLIRRMAGPMKGGRVTKKVLLHNANLLHDMRVMVDIHGGEQGRPYLWEL